MPPQLCDGSTVIHDICSSSSSSSSSSKMSCYQSGVWVSASFQKITHLVGQVSVSFEIFSLAKRKPKQEWFSRTSPCMMKWKYLLIPQFYNLVYMDNSFSRLITINSINTAFTHKQSMTGICCLQNSRTFHHWIASRTDYPSITTNLCHAGTSSSLWYLWGTDKYSAEAEEEEEEVTKRCWQNRTKILFLVVLD